MRLAFVHNHPSGGAARAVHALGLELGRRHEIDVYTLSSADETFAPSQDFARAVYVSQFSAARPVRLALYANDLRRYRDIITLETVYRDMAREIDGGGYDAVFVSACRYLQSPRLLAYVRTPAAYFCHEPPRRFLPAKYRGDTGPFRRYERMRALWHRPADRIIDRALRERDRRNVAASDIVLTNSRFTASLVAAYYGRQAQVCYLGVETALTTQACGAGDYVLSVGTIAEHKGFAFLIEAMAALESKSRPPLLVIGNEADATVRDRLQRLAHDRGVRLSIRTAVSDGELMQAYANARVFAYAPHYEPFGLAALEAMAAGLPVVAVAEGGVVESVVDGVTGLTSPRDAQVFAGKLARLLCEPALARELGAAGRRRAVTDWTWEGAAHRVEAALFQIARRPSSIQAVVASAS